MITCPFCQFRNEDGSLFCEQCKSDLGVAEAKASPAVAAVAAEVAAPPAVAIAAVAAPVYESADTIPIVPLDAAPPPISLAPISAALPTAEPVVAVAAEVVAVADTITASPVPLITDMMGSSATLTAEEISVAATPAAEVAEPAEPAPAPPTAAPAAEVAVGTQPKLVVIRGLKVGVEYTVYEGHNFVGRMDEKPVDIDLEDQESPERVFCSRQHALVTFENGQLTIEDLNSSNGTFVNRNRIYPGQTKPLQAGDVVQIGTVQMKVKMERPEK